LTGLQNSNDTDGYQWLIGPDAQSHLKWATDELDGGQREPTPSVVQRLRKTISPGRASLVLQQVALRARAKRKFSRADEMFFTSVLLEQSTSEAISDYKAATYQAGPVADLCCGIGGDAFGLIKRGLAVTAVDRDPTAGMLTGINTTVYGQSATISVGDVADCPVGDFAAWHMDPDRRPDGRRTTRVESHEPGVAVIEALWNKNPHSLMKLAPAADLPDTWLADCEREWIGEQRECKQQLIRHGDLVRQAGKHSATILDLSGSVIGTVVGEPDQPVDFAPHPDAFIYEPHAAVRAAGLGAELANQHGLRRIGLDTSYVTGGSIAPGGTMSAFCVVESMPFDRKRVKQRIRELEFGHLEIKTRGAGLEPAVEQKKLSTGNAGKPGCVFLFAVEGKVRAVLTERV